MKGTPEVRKDVRYWGDDLTTINLRYERIRAVAGTPFTIYYHIIIVKEIFTKERQKNENPTTFKHIWLPHARGNVFKPQKP